MLAKKGLMTAPAAVAQYVEDVFSTYLYKATSNQDAQTINNGIDLSGEGGLVWFKRRSPSTSSTIDHCLIDTVRGNTKYLSSNLTTGNTTRTDTITAFNNNGFTIGGADIINYANDTVASWTFRKAEKFFDVVTYTGNGTAGRTVAHNLGSVPGCIIVKRTDAADNWGVYHVSLGNTKQIQLQSTGTPFTNVTYWNNTDPTSTNFTVGTSNSVNASGGSYVAYLFAHDAGGFGDAGDQNVISCGSFTTDGSGDATVTLGYEPQFVLLKNSQATGDWYMHDTMRGMAVSGNPPWLKSNLSSAETQDGLGVKVTATGFTVVGASSNTHIYIAIRRGPMKTPEAGTEVFAPVTRNSSVGGVNYYTGFPVDLSIYNARTGPGNYFHARLTAANRLQSVNTAAEISGDAVDFTSNVGYQPGTSSATTNALTWNFRRAPGFFDVVCYTGTGSATTVTHNLGVAPELIILKERNSSVDWRVYAAPLGNQWTGYLNLTYQGDTGTTTWDSTNPTSSVFSLGTDGSVNGSGDTYVAYLFASCPGVSKVGSYTGNGSSQTINCGFTAGARFVLIKRTDSTGDWVVFDSARGIVSGNDPYLELNTTDAEVTDKDAVDTDNTGFVVNETTGPNVNTNSATYIYLAIA